MINITLALTNPFSNRFDTLWEKSGRITKHKVWEVEVLKTTSVAYIDLRITTRQSHAGVMLGLGLLGYEILVSLYDTRHWNGDTNDWDV